MDVDIPPESAVDSYAPGNKSQTKLALLEERNKSIEFVVVANDNSPNSMYILTGLKGIFQRQLPKMPKGFS